MVVVVVVAVVLVGFDCCMFGRVVVGCDCFVGVSLVGGRCW